MQYQMWQAGSAPRTTETDEMGASYREANKSEAGETTKHRNRGIKNLGSESRKNEGDHACKNQRHHHPDSAVDYLSSGQ
jgi:hypothetical protein